MKRSLVSWKTEMDISKLSKKTKHKHKQNSSVNNAKLMDTDKSSEFVQEDMKKDNVSKTLRRMDQVDTTKSNDTIKANAGGVKIDKKDTSDRMDKEIIVDYDDTSKAFDQRNRAIEIKHKHTARSKSHENQDSNVDQKGTAKVVDHVDLDETLDGDIDDTTKACKSAAENDTTNATRVIDCFHMDSKKEYKDSEDVFDPVDLDKQKTIDPRNTTTVTDIADKDTDMEYKGPRKPFDHVHRERLDYNHSKGKKDPNTTYVNRDQTGTGSKSTAGALKDKTQSTECLNIDTQVHIVEFIKSLDVLFFTEDNKHKPGHSSRTVKDTENNVSDAQYEGNEGHHYDQVEHNDTRKVFVHTDHAMTIEHKDICNPYSHENQDSKKDQKDITKAFDNMDVDVESSMIEDATNMVMEYVNIVSHDDPTHEKVQTEQPSLESKESSCKDSQIQDTAETKFEAKNQKHDEEYEMKLQADNNTLQHNTEAGEDEQHNANDSKSSYGYTNNKSTHCNTNGPELLCESFHQNENKAVPCDKAEAKEVVISADSACEEIHDNEHEHVDELEDDDLIENNDELDNNDNRVNHDEIEHSDDHHEDLEHNDTSVSQENTCEHKIPDLSSKSNAKDNDVCIKSQSNASSDNYDSTSKTETPCGLPIGAIISNKQVPESSDSEDIFVSELHITPIIKRVSALSLFINSGTIKPVDSETKSNCNSITDTSAVLDGESDNAVSSNVYDTASNTEDASIKVDSVTISGPFNDNSSRYYDLSIINNDSNTDIHSRTNADSTAVGVSNCFNSDITGDSSVNGNSVFNGSSTKSDSFASSASVIKDNSNQSGFVSTPVDKLSINEHISTRDESTMHKGSPKRGATVKGDAIIAGDLNSIQTRPPKALPKKRFKDRNRRKSSIVPALSLGTIQEDPLNLGLGTGTLQHLQKLYLRRVSENREEQIEEAVDKAQMQQKQFQDGSNNNDELRAKCPSSKSLSEIRTFNLKSQSSPKAMLEYTTKEKQSNNKNGFWDGVLANGYDIPGPNEYDVKEQRMPDKCRLTTNGHTDRIKSTVDAIKDCATKPQGSIEKTEEFKPRSPYSQRKIYQRRFGVSYSPGQLGVYDDAGPPELLVHEADDEWTDDRTHAIDDALEWIKTQLQSMREKDQELATQLKDVHHGIREVKLQRCCEKNREVLDEAIDEYMDDPIAKGITDSLPETLCPTLKDIGLTKMNIKGRRFSVM